MGEMVLPSGWLTTQLRELTIDVSYGYTASSTVDKVGPRMLRITDIQSNKVDWPSVPFCEIEPAKLDKYRLKENDLVFARTGATVGKSFLIKNTPPESVYASYLIRVRTASPDSISFLSHFFNSNQYWQQITEFSAGIGQPNVNGTKLKGLDVPLPPLAEQKAIAQKLDTLLAQVETTKARLDRIPDILKRFRQSVLAAAVSGKLTEEWRVEKTVVSHNEFEEWKWSPIPTNWSVKLYPEVVDSRLGKMLDKSKNTGLPTKYLGNVNVRWFQFDLVKLQEILISESERDELSLREGDVLICEGGEPGRCAIWGANLEGPIVFQKALHRARVNKNEILPVWLAINIKNDANSLTLDQLFTGTTIKHLTGKALKKYPLRIPPIEEQTEIVRRVEQLFAHANAIEQQVQAAQTRVNSLTQSILAKAFCGELTTEWRAANPELISGENSAEALLAKIQAERDAAKPKKKARARK